MSKGICVVIIGVVGSGKTTVIRRLSEVLPDAVMMRTFTSRALRPGEAENGDRYSLSREEFERRVADGEMIEWDEHFGFLYGSSSKLLDELLERHQVVLANVNYVGARAFQNKVPNVLTVFLSVPLDQNIDRIRQRGKMTERELALRLDAVKDEIASAGEFDFIVDNPDGGLDRAVERIREIILERLKSFNDDRSHVR